MISFFLSLFLLSQSTFHYDSSYWSDENEYNLPEGETGFNKKETKLPTYWNISFFKLSWYEDRPTDQLHCH